MTSMLHRVGRATPFEAQAPALAARVRGALARRGDDAGRELRGTGPRGCLISSRRAGRGVPAAVSDRAWLQAMLDAEAALAARAPRAAPARGGVAEVCRGGALRRGVARRRGRRRAATPWCRWREALRDAVGRRRGAPRGDEPGHPRHGGDARRAAGARSRCCDDLARRRRRGRAAGRASTARRRWRRARCSSRRCRRRSGSRRRAG